MKTLLMYGNEADGQVSAFTQRYFSDWNKVGLITPREIYLPSADCDIMMIEKDNLTTIDAPNMVLFLKNKCNLQSLKSVSENSIMIVNSANQRQRAFVSGISAGAVTFGLSQMDTVTFSSLSEHHIVVSLQRSIMAVDGTVIEPMEIPCKTHGICSESMLLPLMTILFCMNQLPPLEHQDSFVLDCEKLASPAQE